MIRIRLWGESVAQSKQKTKFRRSELLYEHVLARITLFHGALCIVGKIGHGRGCNTKFFFAPVLHRLTCTTSIVGLVLVQWCTRAPTVGLVLVD